MKYALILAIVAMLIGSTAIFAVGLMSIKPREVPLRKAVIYDHNGKILKEYSGKLEYVRRSENGVRFWLDGRRVIIQGGIIIVEDE